MTRNASDMYEFGNKREEPVQLPACNTEHINAWAVRKNEDEE